MKRVEIMNTVSLNELVTQLQKAKAATQFCLDNISGLSDMHGLSYWASEVERLREEVKKQL